MSPPRDMERTCPICGGPIESARRDICCVEEDSHLLAEVRALLRSNPTRAGVDIGEVVEHLFDRLRPYLAEKEIDLDDIDPDDVYAEIEKRILRWISRRDISVTSVAGLSVCQTCGAMIMRGRTQCNNCLRGKEMSSLQAPSAARPVSRGMHTRHRK